MHVLDDVVDRSVELHTAVGGLRCCCAALACCSRAGPARATYQNRNCRAIAGPIHSDTPLFCDSCLKTPSSRQPAAAEHLSPLLPSTSACCCRAPQPAAAAASSSPPPVLGAALPCSRLLRCCLLLRGALQVLGCGARGAKVCEGDRTPSPGRTAASFQSCCRPTWRRAARHPPPALFIGIAARQSPAKQH
jgi:hypothetical protein